MTEPDVNLTYAVSAFYSNGNTIDVTASATYSSSNEAVAIMTGNVARGAAVGTATITADYLEKKDYAYLEVIPTGTRNISHITLTPSRAMIGLPGTKV